MPVLRISRYFHRCSERSQVQLGPEHRMTTMTIYENQTFEHFHDYESGRVFEDIEFRHCTFGDCCISIAKDPSKRSIVRNVRLINCQEFHTTLYEAIVEDTLIDGFKTYELVQTWGAVFKHVTLRGKIGRIMITHAADPTRLFLTSAQRQAFDEANAAYYKNVDWALDISQAEFQECSIRGVPARLIRRDPETQAVVTRQKALEGRWRELDLEKTWWHISIQFMLERGDPDVVLVAPKRHRQFKDLLEGVKLLRQAGVAELD